MELEGIADQVLKQEQHLFRIAPDGRQSADMHTGPAFVDGSLKIGPGILDN